MLVLFKHYVGTLEPYLYHNKNLCLRLENPILGHIATCTVNLPDYDPPKGSIFVKDYSENEGMLKTLTDDNIILSPTKTLKTGHVKVHQAALHENVKHSLLYGLLRRYGSDEFPVDKDFFLDLLDYDPKPKPSMEDNDEQQTTAS